MNTTVRAAAKKTLEVAETNWALSDDVRSALRVAATAAMGKSESEEVAALKDLLNHAWIHSAYRDNGSDKMTSEQRALYEALKAEWAVAIDLDSD